MANNIKTVFRYYTIADCTREESWLGEMAANGWRFISTNGFFYTFERCEPEKVAYRLDYSGLREGQRTDYYAMFRDYGWEYLQDINGFSYFRKPAEGAVPEDLEIFSDGESHLRMIKKFMWAKLPIVYLLFCGTLLSNQRVLSKLKDWTLITRSDYFLLAILAFLVLFVCWITFRTFREYFSVKKRYQKGA